MGLFYSNITIYKAGHDDLVAHLRQIGRHAFVSPTIDGYTVVFDQGIDEQDAQEIELLGCDLSACVKRPCIAAVLHDDDVLYLWLFSEGQVIDRYCSLPQYFDPDAKPGPPEGGDSALICSLFDRPDRRNRVDQLLRANLMENEMPEIIGEFERHQALVHELGIPRFAAGLSFAPIAENYVWGEFSDVVFERIA